MTNPTRAQILNAYEALEELKNVALSAADFTSDTVLYTRWKKQILAALPPKPHPTMAEVEWDDDKHYLAEAEHPAWGKAVMLSPNGGYIRCIRPSNAGVTITGLLRKLLTPTGKRYTLTEVQE
ncbi:hypothetical protein [Corynebacterium sp. MSK310]|uniref:hypothetical protein n=1 Tax=Corynebacterium sp. MSK310 TaxID=3050223 RepID=UPI00254F944A|nr:hypothetical protein [Corynebacterium sp. MSK310]MDK8475501.1 hypothetical protein [Corynebacterium sp. MSK310]